MSAHPRPRRRALTAPPPVLALLALGCMLLGVLPHGVASAAVPSATSAVPFATPSTASSTELLTTASRTGAGSTPVPSPSPDDGTPAGSEDDVDPQVTVHITSVSPQVVRPADELTVRATLRNDTEDTIELPRAALRVNRFLQSTRGSLEQWADQPLDGTAGTTIGTPLRLPEPLAPGASVDVELRAPAGALGLSLADAAWGPRGLSVEATDGGRREGIARTFLLWQPTEQSVTPTRVSVLVPLTGGPVDPTAVGTAPSDATERAAGETGTGTEAGTDAGPGDESGGESGDGTSGEAAGATPGPSGPDRPEGGRSEGGRSGDDAGTDEPPTPLDPAPLGAPTDDDLDRLEDVLSATATVPGVSWALDPALLEAARSSASPDRAQHWAEALTDAGAGREVVALPARDPDLAALAHGGGDALAAQAYGVARAASDPLLGAVPRAELAWPADDVPDLATVGLAARSGAAAVVVGGDALVTDRLTYTPTGRGTVTTPDGDVAALVADDVLTDQLADPSDATAATAAQRVLAESAVLTRERPSEQRHVLVTASRAWTPDPAVARAQLTALTTAPWVEVAGVSELVATPDPGLDRTSLPRRQVDQDEIPPGEIAALLAARSALTAFAGIVADPADLLAGADDAVLAPGSVAWRVDPVQRTLVVDAVVADLAARRQGVSVVPSSSLLVISEAGRFLLTVRNDLAQDVTVQLAAVPASPALVIEEAPTVSVPAGTDTQVRVPFRAVGNGEVRVTVTLLAPDGTVLGAPQELTVRVRADWENVGTAVVAGLLGLAVVVGLVRTIRRGQTRHRGAGDTPVSEIARLPEDAS